MQQYARPTLKLVTAPALTPVTVEELRTHLRIDHNDDDATLAGMIEAATGALDGPQGMLGRAIVTQTWVQLQRAPCDNYAMLCVGPVASIVDLKYLDQDDVEQQITLADFRLVDGGSFSYVEPRQGKSWPGGMSDRPDALRITVTAGTPVADVRVTIKQAVKLLAGHWYEEREGSTVSNLKNIPYGVERLVNIDRLRGWIS